MSVKILYSEYLMQMLKLYLEQTTAPFSSEYFHY